MRIIATAVFVLLACSSGYADIVIDFTSATNPLTNVDNFSPGTSSTSQMGTVGNTATQVSVVSDLPMVAQGQTLDPAAGTGMPLMTSLGSLVISFPNVIGVRDFSQNLDFTGSGASSSENNGGLADVLVTVNYTDANGNNPQSSFGSLDFESSASGRYDVTTTSNEIITQVTLQWINGAEVTASKQIRINASSVAVPEPSAFACLGLVGLSGVGLRRSVRWWRKKS